MFSRAVRAPCARSRPSSLRPCAPSLLARPSSNRNYVTISSSRPHRNQGQQSRGFHSAALPIARPQVREAAFAGWLGAGLALAATAYLLTEPDEAQAKEQDKTQEVPSKLPVKFSSEMRTLLGERFVTDYGTRASHGKDFSYHAAGDPEAVLFPLTSGSH